MSGLVEFCRENKITIKITNKKLSYRKDSARCGNGHSRSSVVMPIDRRSIWVPVSTYI